jgi:D-serine dehydratase
LDLSGEEHLQVGDLVCCGISHPCLAFDKWRAIPVVNDDYEVVDLYHTFF